MTTHRRVRGPNWDPAFSCSCGERFPTRRELEAHIKDRNRRA